MFRAGETEPAMTRHPRIRRFAKWIRRIVLGLSTLAAVATLVLGAVSTRKGIDFHAYRKDVQFLRFSFGQLEVQVVRSMMTGVSEPLGGRKWSRRSTPGGTKEGLLMILRRPPPVFTSDPRDWTVSADRRFKLGVVAYDSFNVNNVSGFAWETPFNVSFEANTQLRRKSVHVQVLNLPLWIALLLFGTYPAIASIGFIRGPYRRWRRQRKGCCPSCGYNLKGNVSGVCPECGNEVVINP